MLLNSVSGWVPKSPSYIHQSMLTLFRLPCLRNALSGRGITATGIRSRRGATMNSANWLQNAISSLQVLSDQHKIALKNMLVLGCNHAPWCILCAVWSSSFWITEKSTDQSLIWLVPNLPMTNIDAFSGSPLLLSPPASRDAELETSCPAT